MRRRLFARWNAFWFEPKVPTPLALFRIVFGLLLLHHGMLLAPEVLTLYGDQGILTRDTWRLLQAQGAIQSAPIPLWNVMPSGDGWVVALFVMFLLAAAGLTVGLFTRASAAMAYLILLAFHNRNPIGLYGVDGLIEVFAFWLIFSPAGRAMSLDRLRQLHRRRQKEPPLASNPLAWRMIQVQLALMYAMTSVAKMTVPGWWDGSALYVHVRMEELARLPLLPPFLDHLWMYQPLGWSVLLIESALWMLVWFREFRYLVLALGVLLHLGIEWVFNIPLFSAVAVAAYLTFIEPDDLHRLLEAAKARVGWTQVPAGATGATTWTSA